MSVKTHQKKKEIDVSIIYYYYFLYHVVLPVTGVMPDSVVYISQISDRIRHLKLEGHHRGTFKVTEQNLVELIRLEELTYIGAA